MRRKWTKEECDLLELFYLDGDKQTILRLLKGRSWGSICTQAHKLGLSRFKFGSDERRFWNKVDIKQDGCWLWLASCNKYGYGAFRKNGKYIGAHVFAYELFNGKIEGDLCIDHLCKNRKCVNPSHMELVTRGENTRRGMADRPRQLFCLRGHQKTQEGRCLQCHADREYNRRNKNTARNKYGGLI